MMESLKVIETLKKQFKITCIAFKTQREVVEAITGKEPPKTRMEEMHQNMLAYLSSENPDIHTIDTILQQMEMLADINLMKKELAKQNNSPKYPKGGVDI